MGYTKEQRIINSMTGSTKQTRQPQQTIPTNLTGSFNLPNHSGDNSAGMVRSTPVNDTDLVNKKYVDDEISGEDLWDRTGTNTYLKNTTDDVGIGTTSPNRPLHIALSSNATSTTGVSSYQAL